MVKAKTRVVVVGGGFAGVKLALELANKPEFSVQLISNNTHFEYHGALYRSAVGHSPKEVVIPLKEIFKHARNVELVLDTIAFIDEKKQRIVSSDGNSYSYDKVAFALGNTVNYFHIPGMKENTYTMHDISSTMQLRRGLIDMFSQPQRRPVRIAVVGGGPSGIELAGELPYFAKLVARHHKQPDPRLHILLVEASSRLLPNLSSRASDLVTKRLIKLGVEIHLNIAVESCKKGQLCMSAGMLHADMIIWTAGSTSVPFFSANSHIFSLSPRGKVMVDDCLQVRGHKNIYVLGDNAETPHSGMAQTAIHDAKYLARNLIRAQHGKKIVSYRTRKPLFVITAGGNWAVVEKNKKTVSGLRGWRIRRQADLWIFKNFEPYKQAIATWRSGNKMTKNL